MTHDREDTPETLRVYGLRFASLIRRNPNGWQATATWLARLPRCWAVRETDKPDDPRWKDRILFEVPNSPAGHPFFYYDDEAYVAGVWGPVCRKLFDGWDATLHRFSERERDRYFDFCAKDAKRICLLAALTLNVDFDGTEVGLNLPWDPPEPQIAEFDGRGWAWAKITSGLGTESSLLRILKMTDEYLELMPPVASSGSPVSPPEPELPELSKESTTVIRIHPAEEPQRRSVFKRSGEAWEVDFGGVRTHLNDRQGMSYVRYLLANPNRRIHVVELETGGRVKGIATAEPQELLDRQARSQVVQRLEDLAENPEITPGTDPASEAEVREEAGSLQASLRASLAKAGTPRAIPDETEKMRGRVAKAIEAVLQVIAQYHKPLYEHLVESSEDLAGRRPIYHPEPLVMWATGSADS